VIKRELLWDPCLDIVGHRLPNYFIRRGSEDSDREVRALRDLIRGVRPDEGVLVYPEGTRFSPAKRERILARLRERGQEGLARRAASLKNVLPPRLGGPLALLEDNPGLDVVVCAHTGFERATSFWELWNGGLRKLEVRVCFWRIPFAEIPREREERIDWLFAQWSRIDTWIDRTAGPSGSAARE
jgi:1-acyl-sn-glycerol-3-phosphate acyltransferase